LVDSYLKKGQDVLAAVQSSIKQLRGAYALAVIHASEPNRMICAREGSPLVIGVGIGENFIASDQLALLPVTDRFLFMEEGDIAEITMESIRIWDVTEIGRASCREIV